MKREKTNGRMQTFYCQGTFVYYVDDRGVHIPGNMENGVLFYSEASKNSIRLRTNDSITINFPDGDIQDVICFRAKVGEYENYTDSPQMRLNFIDPIDKIERFFNEETFCTKLSSGELYRVNNTYVQVHNYYQEPKGKRWSLDTRARWSYNRAGERVSVEILGSTITLLINGACYTNPTDLTGLDLDTANVSIHPTYFTKCVDTWKEAMDIIMSPYSVKQSMRDNMGWESFDNAKFGETEVIPILSDELDYSQEYSSPCSILAVSDYGFLVHTSGGILYGILVEENTYTAVLGYYREGSIFNIAVENGMVRQDNCSYVEEMFYIKDNA